MTTEKIKTATEVITEFLDAQSQDHELDSNTLKAIRDLRTDGKLTKINLVRQLDAMCKAAVISTSEKVIADD